MKHIAIMPLLYIVDDDVFYLEFLKKELQKDYEIKIFETAEDCILSINERAPDLIVTDFYLPGMTGFDLMTNMKDRLPETRFILLSSTEDGNLVLELIRKGVRNYVIKDKDVIKNIHETIAEEMYRC